MGKIEEWENERQRGGEGIKLKWNLIHLTIETASKYAGEKITRVFDGVSEIGPRSSRVPHDESDRNGNNQISENAPKMLAQFITLRELHGCGGFHLVSFAVVADVTGCAP